MNEKEQQVQKALGLLKTYNGYVQVQGNTHYDVYEVQDVTLEGASEQLHKIIKEVQKNSKVSLKLKFIVDEMEEPYGDWTRSNFKS